MEITEIKQQLNILDLVKSYGHTPNRNNAVKCPFHEDKKPSLLIYPKTNTWHCFGCDKGTDVIDFIQFKENCTTHQAIEIAKQLLGGIEFIKNEIIQPKEVEQPKINISESQRIETLTKAFTYFSRSTKSEAKQYLENRKLDITKLTVGFDNHSFHKSKEVTQELKELYQNVGLLYADKLGRENCFHSFFDGCIIFPLFNEKGAIINLYGRSIDETKQSKHRYLPGQHQGIYPNYPKSETTHLIITECIVDCATLQSLSLDNYSFSALPLGLREEFSLLSLYGTNNFTQEMQVAIKNLKQLKEVILFFDGDTAGKNAMQTHSNTLKEQNPNLKISFINTPENEDINSLSQLYGENTKEFIKELLDKRHLDNRQQDENPMKEGCVQVLDKEVVEFFKSDDRNTLTSLNTDNPEQLIFKNEYLTASVWGGIDFQNIKKLRATLHLQSSVNMYLEYRDTVDLYANAQTQRLIREASEKLEIGTSTMTKTVSEITKSLENYRNIEREKERKRKEAEKQFNVEIFTPAELQEGKALLKSNDLMAQTEAYIKEIGLVGEEDKGLLLFFILLTRMFKNPLHALVQGRTGSGKTYLLKKIASLVPKAQLNTTTALTENTLYHSLKGFWKHKVLLIEDLDGVLSALLPLREMMSNQSISKFSTEKNLKTGDFEPKFLYVEGPICVAGATTKDSIYEDNANRSFLIQVNETSEYEQKALEQQRIEVSGLLDTTNRERAELLFKTAQLHLVPMEVVIPFGEELRLPDHVLAPLRTNAHYLVLIKAIAFWHQGQREIKEKSDGTRYLEATLDDVEWANRLSKDVLLRKSDELNGNLRGFFENIKGWMKSTNKDFFQAKLLRESFRMNPMKLNRYLRDLEQRGYIKQTGGNRKIGFEFSVVVWDDYEQLKASMNILDEILEKLRNKYKN